MQVNRAHRVGLAALAATALVLATRAVVPSPTRESASPTPAPKAVSPYVLIGDTIPSPLAWTCPLTSVYNLPSTWETGRFNSLSEPSKYDTKCYSYTDGDYFGHPTDEFPATGYGDSCTSPMQTSGWEYSDMILHMYLWVTSVSRWHEEYILSMIDWDDPVMSDWRNEDWALGLYTSGELSVYFICDEGDVPVGSDQCVCDRPTPMIAASDVGLRVENGEILGHIASTAYYASPPDIDEGVYYASVVEGNTYGVQLEKQCNAVTCRAGPDGEPDCPSACNELRWRAEHDFQPWMYHVYDIGDVGGSFSPVKVFSTLDPYYAVFGDQVYQPGWLIENVPALSIHPASPYRETGVSLANEAPVAGLHETGCWDLFDYLEMVWIDESMTDVMAQYRYGKAIPRGLPRPLSQWDLIWSWYLLGSQPNRGCQ